MYSYDIIQVRAFEKLSERWPGDPEPGGPRNSAGGDPMAEEACSPSQGGEREDSDGDGFGSAPMEPASPTPVAPITPAAPAGARPERPAGPARIEWIEGSVDTGPADGLCWSYELDLGELLAAAGLAQAGVPDDPAEPVGQEASLAEELELIEAAGGRARGRDLTGLLAEHLPAGPGLAAWLANGPSGEWSDWDLPGVAASYRRVGAGRRPGNSRRSRR
jgi:hypothetical protein